LLREEKEKNKKKSSVLKKGSDRHLNGKKRKEQPERKKSHPLENVTPEIHLLASS